MAYTPIDKGENFFNTVLYNGTGSNQSITGVGFKPDWIWGKTRSSAQRHVLTDVVRGINEQLASDSTATETSYTNSFTAFGSDGFSVGTDNGTNMASQTQVAWNWIAAGANPSNTYVVKVVSDGGNKYRFDDFGTSTVTLEISEGGTFTFDQSDSSNSGHPIRFSTTSDGSHGGGSEYTTGVTTNGTPGNAGAYTRITVAASAPTLYYYCTAHSGMGGQANTPVTNSFSSFAGSIQSNISPNTTSKFSIVSYTGTGSNATVGHGMGATPTMMIIKNRDDTDSWYVWHQGLGAVATNYITLDTNGAKSSVSDGITALSSTTFSLGNRGDVNASSEKYIAYCFAEKQGYSKFGSYVGNGNADGTFIYTGQKSAFIMLKNTTRAASWLMYDNKRLGYNVDNNEVVANTTAVEETYDQIDILSNGFKMRANGTSTNLSGDTYIYMAFAENPFVTSTGVPACAR